MLNKYLPWRDLKKRPAWPNIFPYFLRTYLIFAYRGERMGSKIAQTLFFYLPEDALCDREKDPCRYGKRQSAGKNGDPETRLEGMFYAYPYGYN